MQKSFQSLTSDQKEKHQEICADILKQIEENPEFLYRVITLRYGFSGTTLRQKDSQCIIKLQTDQEFRKQDKSLKFKAMLMLFF